MINFMATKVTEKLIKKKFINDVDFEKYEYGIKLILISLSQLIFMLLIGILLSQTVEAIIFCFIFVYIKSYSGGYHIKQLYLCTTFSVLLLISTLLLVNYVIYDLYFLSGFAILTFSLFVILKFSPIENVNRPKSSIQIKICKKILQKRLLVIVILCIILAILGDNYLKYYFCISASMLFVSLNVLLAVKLAVKNN